jgi:hypothetical protein
MREGNLYKQPLAGGPTVPLTHFASGRIFNFQWSRQGRIVLSRGSETMDAVLLSNFRQQHLAGVNSSICSEQDVGITAPSPHVR